MQHQTKIRQTLIEYDPEATRDAYAKVEGGINSCKCGYCANYRLVRERVYPQEFRAVLEQLGIDYSKEVELDHLTDDESRDGPNYGQSVSGHYAFVGRVLKADTRPPSQDSSRFDYAVRLDWVHPVTKAAFTSPDFIDLEFWVPHVPKAVE